MIDYLWQHIVIVLIILACVIYIVRSVWHAWSAAADPSRPAQCATCTSPCKLKDIVNTKQANCPIPVKKRIKSNILHKKNLQSKIK